MVLASVTSVLRGGKLSALWLCAPVAIALYLAKQSSSNNHIYDIAICIFSIFGYFTVSERLGYVNSQLSRWSVSGFVGLITSLLNNISVFFLALFGVVHNLNRLTQLCLLGSILTNLSLVLGATFFLGGLIHFTQKFNKIAAQINATLLIVSTMTILYPTLLTLLHQETSWGEEELAHGSCLVLLTMFLGILYFQWISHHHLYEAIYLQSNQRSTGPTDNKEDNHNGSHSSLIDLVTTMTVVATTGKSGIGSVKGSDLAGDNGSGNGPSYKKLPVHEEVLEEEGLDEEHLTIDSEDELAMIEVMKNRAKYNNAEEKGGQDRKDDKDDEEKNCGALIIDQDYEEQQKQLKQQREQELAEQEEEQKKEEKNIFHHVESLDSEYNNMKTRSGDDFSPLLIDEDDEEDDGDLDEEMGGRNNGKVKKINKNKQQQKKEKKKQKMCLPRQSKRHQKEEEEDNDQEPLHPICCFVCLTFLLAILAETMISTIEYTTNKLQISPVFMAAILLPFISSFSSHLDAILGGMHQSTVDSSLQKIMDSSTHLVQGILPIIVLIGWMNGNDQLTLNFGAYEASCLVVTVISTVFAIHDGISHWMVGLMLLCAYVIMAFGFFVHRALPF